MTRRPGPRLDVGEIWCECDEVTSDIFDDSRRIRIDLRDDTCDTGGILSGAIVLGFRDVDALRQCNGEARFKLTHAMAYRLGRQLIAAATMK